MPFSKMKHPRMPVVNVVNVSTYLTTCKKKIQGPINFFSLFHFYCVSVAYDIRLVLFTF
jgi:hypothetical protein